MDIFTEKLKTARKLLKLSQAQLAESVGMAQKDVSNIENGSRQYIPNQYISFLLSKGIDIASVYDPAKEVSFITKGISQHESVEVKHRGKHRDDSKSEILPLQKVGEPAGEYLPTWMDDNKAVDIVDVRAAANVQGLSIHDGPIEKIGVLPVPKHLIYQSRHRRHLWFPIVGDSMEPTIYVDDYVLAALVEPQDYQDIRDNYIYIISTREHGILIKRVLNRLSTRGQLYAKSDNRAYSSYNIDESEIISIWFACARLSFKFPNEQISLFNKYVDLEARIEQLENKK